MLMDGTGEPQTDRFGILMNEPGAMARHAVAQAHAGSATLR